MATLLPGISAVIAVWLLITQPWAQQPSSSRDQPAAPSLDVFSYGDADKTCARWTDGCRNCSRGAGPLPDCSNIGLACQPEGKVTCFGRTPGDPKT
jgi:hypothetical protein